MGYVFTDQEVLYKNPLTRRHYRLKGEPKVGLWATVKDTIFAGPNDPDYEITFCDERPKTRGYLEVRSVKDGEIVLLDTLSVLTLVEE